MREEKIDRMHLTDVFVEPGRRPVDTDVVARLCESILKIGLMTPITVKIVDKYIDPVEGELDKAAVLVSGRHRLEAVRALGHKEIDCFVWDDPNSARMWEIAENLHRSELTVKERADNVAEWIELCDKGISGQVVQKRGRPKGGVSAASRELGIGRKEAERAVKIASITREANEAAREAGLDDNQRALLQIAAAPASQQVATVESISAKAIEQRNKRKRRAPRVVAEEESQHDRDLRMLNEAWDRACISALRVFSREKFESLRDLAA
jgi:ParB-like chromosome segregation protein Spo0J